MAPAIVVPDLGVKRIRDHHGDRAGLAGSRRSERLEDAPGDLGLMVDLEDCLDDRPQDRRVGQPVDLADLALGPRSMSVMMPTIGMLSKSASPMPVMALVSPGPGTTEKTPTSPVTRAAASAMTLADDSCVTSRYGNSPGLQRVPELVVLGPGNAEDAADALAAEGCRRRLCAGHVSLDARSLGEAAKLDDGRPALRDRRRHGHGRAENAASGEQLPPVNLG